MNLDSRINGGILGCNLFAYCLNNPLNYFDDCGQIPIALIPVAVVLEELLINLGTTFFIFDIAEKMVDCFTSLEPQDIPQHSIPDKPSTKAQSQADTKAQSIAGTKTAKQTESNTVYYGCKINNHEMIFITEAMAYNEAYIWAMAMELGSVYGIGMSGVSASVSQMCQRIGKYVCQSIGKSMI